MKWIRHSLQWVARRGVFFISVMILGVGVLLIWLIVTSFSQSATTITIGIASVTALFAAISSIASLLQATEAQRQRESRDRPYVLTYFDISNLGAVDFIIQNIGNSPAYDLSIRFDPPPIDYAKRPLDTVSLFAKPISFLEPGKTLRQLVNIGSELLAEGKPQKFRVGIEYRSSSYEIFRDVTDHDLSTYTQAILPPKTTSENLEAISKELHELNGLLKSVCGLGAILAESPDAHQARLKRIRDERHPDQRPRWKFYIISVLDRIRSILE